MVSYLYRYDKGIKGKNTGYARIERNDRRCRVTIRLQDTVSVSPSVFFFIQNEGGMQRIPAGKLARNGSGFAGRVETPVDRMAGSEYAFDRIDGIYLSGPENVFYATTWKDITVSGAAPEKEADGWKAEDDRDDGNRSDAGSGSEESRPQAVNTASTEIRQESERQNLCSGVRMLWTMPCRQQRDWRRHLLQKPPLWKPVPAESARTLENGCFPCSRKCTRLKLMRWENASALT